MDSRIVADMTDDERDALSWLSKPDHRTRWSVLVALVIPTMIMGAELKIFIANNMVADPSISGGITFSLISYFIIRMFLTILPVGGKKFWACHRLSYGFVGLSESGVGSSNLPQSLRDLHRTCIRTMQRIIPVSTAGMARKIFNRGGPEAALAFLRIGKAFIPLKGKLRNMNFLVDATMEKDAAMVLAALCPPVTSRKVVLDYSSPTLVAPSTDTTDTNAGNGALSYGGGLIDALLISGVRAVPAPFPVPVPHV